MSEHPAYGELRPVRQAASVLLQNNPNHMTLDGTNSWVLSDLGSPARVVVDPGEDDGEHLEQLADGPPVALVLLTHHHHDHAGGIDRFVELTGAPVRALDPSLCRRAEPLTDGETMFVAGVNIRVIATPGHTADSLSFLVGGNDPALLTGDTILGRGTTVIAHPDGALGPYLDSLRLLAELIPAGTPVLPGHGPELPDATAVAREYLAHREQRLDQVRAALEKLGPDATPREVVEMVYADVEEKLWDAAEWSVRAQLDYLRG
ncbi:MBL fold metallo-hydrolase [Pseudonocardia endophytica]|uniref:Glyoxylase-like metal-dependent hydrolase (Beta-lactamase superfamily II) n=1 Tax=Pseudonocardia endophytica TaxID=401976 RepID=A0A4R1I2I3_PSEEN|nr:MBL fold metallo-hydrolase [Pseudonocardia endophytica]TCK27825.1 glyoxylase-like metal-dependent hydrolase (beta-lactamase superfamily II) [Pseudonocardia endophytica]